MTYAPCLIGLWVFVLAQTIIFNRKKLGGTLMIKILKSEKAFTLIEMMIVLLVISVLLFITIPNVTKQSNNINSKGCEAFVHMVEAEIEAYKIDHNKAPQDIDTLVEEDYLKGTSCPNGGEVTIDGSGNVAVSSS
jgi:competence protein ComGC